MNTEELTMLLTRMAIVDGRDVDQLTLEAWEPLIGDLDYQDTVEGLNEHYRTDSRRPTASQIRVSTDNVRRSRLYAGERTAHQCIPHRHTLAEEVGSCREHHWGESGRICWYGCTQPVGR